MPRHGCSLGYFVGDQTLLSRSDILSMNEIEVGYISQRELYTYGLHATDVEFPKSEDPHYKRWLEHMYRVTIASYGFCVHYGWVVDATNIKEAMRQKYGVPMMKDVGLILCEQPYSEGENQQKLQSRILMSMTSQFKDSGILCVVVVRKSMVDIICAHAYPPPAKIARRVDIVDVDMHYKPKRNNSSYVTEHIKQ